MRTMPVHFIAVLQLVADGCTNADIARELRISLNMVKKHLQRICDMMGADNRAHAVALGFRQRILT